VLKVNLGTAWGCKNCCRAAQEGTYVEDNTSLRTCLNVLLDCNYSELNWDWGRKGSIYVGLQL